MNSTSALRRAVQLGRLLGEKTTQQKCALMDFLKKHDLAKASDVLQFHDLLCYLRAYPDNEEVLSLVAGILDQFDQRSDLKRFKNELADTGIAGTNIYFRFYWSTALWLTHRWPENLSIDWDEFDNHAGLEEVCTLILPYPDTLAFEETTLSLRQMIRLAKHREQTDAAFVVEQFRHWKTDHTMREKIYEDIDIPMRLKPGKSTPSRTKFFLNYKPVHFHSTTPASTGAGYANLNIKSVSITEVSPTRGRKLVDLARVQMITRSRDLYAFMYADKNDVRIAEYEGGIQIICYGLIPQHRLMFEGLTAFLILKNGVPIGYTQASCLFQSAEVNFNIFDSFRGAETSRIFTITLSLIRTLFGATAYIINSQQLGVDNHEALNSGAFWFYYKHGFRPKNRQVKSIISTELKRKAENPSHRSSISTLKDLAQNNMYRYLKQPRRHVISHIKMHNLAIACSLSLTRENPSNRAKAVRQCALKTAKLLGLDAFGSLSRNQRIAWERWSPLVLAIPGVANWNRTQRETLAAVIKAKGGRRESEFVARFDQHVPLRRAVLKLAESRLDH